MDRRRARQTNRSRNTSPGSERRIREWKSLERIRAIISREKGQTTRGILLVGPGSAAEELALQLAHERAARPLILQPPGRAYAAVNEQVRATLEPDPQLVLGESRSAPVIVLLRLDQFREPLLSYLKARLERPVIPWLCVATCESTQRLPDFLSGMFLESRALKVGGRPRKQEPPA